MDIRFLLRETFRGLRRNLIMVFALVLTTAVTLTMVGASLAVGRMAEHTKSRYLDEMEVLAFLELPEGTDDPNCVGPVCRGIKDRVAQLPGVASAEFVKIEAAYEFFVAEFQDVNPELVKNTDPSAIEPHLRIRMSDTTVVEKVVDGVAAVPGVADIRDDRNFVANLFRVIDSIRAATWIFAAVMGVVALLLIANSVRLSVYTRRRELTIMRQLGATRAVAYLPIIAEVLFAATVGTALALGALIGLKSLLLDRVLSGSYETNTIARVTLGDIALISPIVILIGVGGAVLTAYVSVRLTDRRSATRR